MRAALLFFVPILWLHAFTQAHAQSSLRTLRLLPGQSCVGDSLNLMPGSLVTGAKPNLLSPASGDWTLDLANNQWCLPKGLKDTLWVSFRVLPFRLYDTLRDPYWNPVPLAAKRGLGGRARCRAWAMRARQGRWPPLTGSYSGGIPALTLRADAAVSIFESGTAS